MFGNKNKNEVLDSSDVNEQQDNLLSDDKNGMHGLSNE